MKNNILISLGSQCEPSMQYRRIFSEDPPSSPFDWLIGSLEAVNLIFKDNFENIMTDISPVMEGNNFIDNFYNIIYAHDFKKNGGGVHISVDLIESTRDKYIHKYNKMINLAAESTPYFLFWVHPGSRTNNTEILKTEALFELENLIEHRIRHKYFKILIIVPKSLEAIQVVLNKEAVKSSTHLEYIPYDDSNESTANSFWQELYTSIVHT
jgi:hypothetical protein